MNIEHATPELFAALAAAQAKVKNADKNAQNPHYRSRYADLAEVLNTVRADFAKNGIGILQAPSFDGAMVHVETVLTHTSGGWVSATASCVPAKSDAQGIGAATTYLRRYGLAAMTAVAQEDDDGESAAHADKPAPVAAKPAPVPDKPVMGMQEEAAAIRDYLDAIATADWDLLDKLGPEIAASHISVAGKKTIRTEFGKRLRALKEPS